MARQRARSEVVPSAREVQLSPAVVERRQRLHSADGTEENDAEFRFGLPRRAATSAITQDAQSPRRAARSSATVDAEEPSTRPYRRSITLSQQTILNRPRSIAARSRITPTMGQAGPEDTSALRTAHENYVNPSYIDLNPAYEQSASSKPIWSLAKALPRVVRPGMVPTQSEIESTFGNAQLPAENSQQVGLDVNPIDLEEGRVQGTLNPAILSAQLKDSRTQRETNFIQNAVQRRGTVTTRLSTRPSRATSSASETGRRGRAASRASQQPVLAPTSEQLTEDQASDQRVEQQDQTSGSGAGEAFRSSTSNTQLQQDFLEPIPEYHEPHRSSFETDASQVTIRVEDEADLQAEMEDLKLQAENPPLYDEIHNNHTAWSVFRTRHRELLAELLAVWVQETLGYCADISATLNGNSANVNTTAWAWGFATMVGIYISGGISGAHLNPVITIMLWFYRGFPKRKMIPYFFAQFLGAILAAFTAYGLYWCSIRAYELDHDPVDIINGFVTGQRKSYIDAATAFFNELLGVAMLSCAVLALGDDQNAPPGAGMNALVIGLLITGLNFSFAYQSGAALNPSRDFGPRLAMLALGYGKQLFLNPFWFYGPWAGTLCGAFVGAGLYDTCIFTGGESPINYPWTRTKRSFKKGKAKWKRRARALRKKETSEKDVEAGISNYPVVDARALEMQGVSQR